MADRILVFYGSYRWDRQGIPLADFLVGVLNALLVLSPSWLEHLVAPHGSGTPRVTIAFNAIATRD